MTVVDTLVTGNVQSCGRTPPAPSFSFLTLKIYIEI